MRNPASVIDHRGTDFFHTRKPARCNGRCIGTYGGGDGLVPRDLIDFSFTPLPRHQKCRWPFSLIFIAHPMKRKRVQTELPLARSPPLLTITRPNRIARN